MYNKQSRKRNYYTYISLLDVIVTHNIYEVIILGRDGIPPIKGLLTLRIIPAHRYTISKAENVITILTYYDSSKMCFISLMFLLYLHIITRIDWVSYHFLLTILNYHNSSNLSPITLLYLLYLHIITRRD